jgi:hypothetical protein
MSWCKIADHFLRASLEITSVENRFTTDNARISWHRKRLPRHWQ